MVTVIIKNVAAALGIFFESLSAIGFKEQAITKEPKKIKAISLI